MISTQSVLHYVDLKGFNKFIPIVKITKDYLFNESSSVKLSLFDPNTGNPIDGPVMSVAAAIGPTFNLNSVIVKNV
jgi:hypothetical protein